MKSKESFKNVRNVDMVQRMLTMRAYDANTNQHVYGLPSVPECLIKSIRVPRF